MRKVKANVTMDAEVYQRLKNYAASCGCSASQYLQYLVTLDGGNLADRIKAMIEPEIMVR